MATPPQTYVHIAPKGTETHRKDVPVLWELFEELEDKISNIERELTEEEILDINNPMFTTFDRISYAEEIEGKRQLRKQIGYCLDKLVEAERVINSYL